MFDPKVAVVGFLDTAFLASHRSSHCHNTADIGFFRATSLVVSASNSAGRLSQRKGSSHSHGNTRRVLTVTNTRYQRYSNRLSPSCRFAIDRRSR
ncbi:hypothetical protein O9992_29525 [Vibrio lentus]|nr:hypothetical protein [Vibrio lentus]